MRSHDDQVQEAMIKAEQLRAHIKEIAKAEEANADQIRMQNAEMREQLRDLLIDIESKAWETEGAEVQQSDKA